MSSGQRRKKGNRVFKAALTVVRGESASKAAAEEMTAAPGVAPETRNKQTPHRQQAAQVWRNLLSQLGVMLGHVTQNAIRLMGQVKVRRATKRLHLRESVSLGDKRFVAIVQVDGQEFLLGGSPNSVSMLAQLSSTDSSTPVQVPAFSQALKQQCEADRNLA